MKQKLLLKQIILLFATVTILQTLLVNYAFAWGGTGHKIVNRKAAMHLPPGMSSFKADSLFYEAHASDADGRKIYTDTSFYAEYLRHYIDIDEYPNFQNLPHNLDSVIALYGRSTVRSLGTLPWATVMVLDSLTAQLSRSDLTKAKQTASDLGHYVADGHQPLHCTTNYDGQLTNNNGIHSRYETSMLNTYQSLIVIASDSAEYITSPLDYVFDYIYYSNSWVDSILAADNYAKSVSGWTGTGTAPSAYYTALWQRTQIYTKNLFQKGTSALANLWYTAWVNSQSTSIVFNTKYINYGSLLLNYSKVDSITVSNQSSQPMNITSAISDNNRFTVSPTTVTIPQNSSRKIYITFIPDTIGLTTGKVILMNNISGKPDTVSVTGMGIYYTVSSKNLNFGNLAVNLSKTDSLTVTNQSSQALNISSAFSDDNRFTVSPASATIPQNSSRKFYITFLPDTLGLIAAKIVLTNNWLGSPDTISVEGVGQNFAINISYNSNWNLISNPVMTSKDSVLQLFRSALSSYVYHFITNVGYERKFVIETGKGYWAKFSEAGSESIQGNLILCDTIDVHAGWNLVGSISIPVSVGEIVPLNTTIVSPFYGFRNGYNISDTILPGSGHWIKVSNEGHLILASPNTSLKR